MKVGQLPKFGAGELNVYSAPADVADVTRALRHTGRRIMLVPTMGALHDGHLTLVRAAKRVPGSVVVVSIFVNPLQFGAGEDLDAYPRTLDQDVELLRGEGVEIVFAPSAAGMYPHGLRTTVQPGPLAAELEGGSRPTHFAGVLTVVLKLLQIVRPDRAFFGEKDYQQLVLIRQMVADLNLDVQVAGVPTVRTSNSILCRIFQVTGVCVSFTSTPRAHENRFSAPPPQRSLSWIAVFHRGLPSSFRVSSNSVRSALPCGESGAGGGPRIDFPSRGLAAK